mmetsp:Transcript_25966/g.50917  ORF Transcript_25966/g.50917 Transcript_25966/m.50917 type:complete len:97 (+) Transcript_25966:781-1071(+)
MHSLIFSLTQTHALNSPSPLLGYLHSSNWFGWWWMKEKERKNIHPSPIYPASWFISLCHRFQMINCLPPRPSPREKETEMKTRLRASSSFPSRSLN